MLRIDYRTKIPILRITSGDGLEILIPIDRSSLRAQYGLKLSDKITNFIGLISGDNPDPLAEIEISPVGESISDSLYFNWFEDGATYLEWNRENNQVEIRQRRLSDRNPQSRPVIKIPRDLNEFLIGELNLLKEKINNSN
jgi:hypothetical protein